MSDQDYSEDGFWDKLKNYAVQAGKDVIEKALLLYYAAQRAETPAWAKATIYGALAYFISPLDAVPDITPIVGYTDDMGALAAAIAMTAAYINEDVRIKANQKLKDWFG